jgi:hypothetical protein
VKNLTEALYYVEDNSLELIKTRPSSGNGLTDSSLLAMNHENLFTR